MCWKIFSEGRAAAPKSLHHCRRLTANFRIPYEIRQLLVRLGRHQPAGFEVRTNRRYAVAEHISKRESHPVQMTPAITANQAPECEKRVHSSLLGKGVVNGAKLCERKRAERGHGEVINSNNFRDSRNRIKEERCAHVPLAKLHN